MDFIVYLELIASTEEIWASTHEETCLQGLGNNKGTDQSVQMRRLISAFVVRFFGSIISKLTASEISII